MRPLIENTTASRLTRIRCYELAGYLANATGQKFDLEVPESVVFDFIDWRGTTDTVYSELTMWETEGSSYTAVILLYQLTTFEGKAVMQNDYAYEFEDETSGVKGIIRVLDGNSWATFEIIESDSSLVNTGDVFEFPERRE